MRLLAVVCLLVGGGLAFAAEKERPFATCHLNGQLGNQLFEIATTLAYAWDHDFVPLFPDLRRRDLNIPLNREKIFFRLNSSRLPRKRKYTFRAYDLFRFLAIPVRPDQCLIGTFLSWRYFDHHRSKLLELFAPSEEELAYLNEVHGELLSHPCTVAVHVRTYNSQLHKHTHPFVGLDYYRKAMDLFPPEALFVVFSDRINWCKHHFASWGKKVTFVQDRDHVDDFYLMSLMKHQIIGNSTFSWWAAYLNQNSDKVVVAPDYFIAPKMVLNGGAEPNCNMPGWIEVAIDPDAPYPVDMRDYDAVSQSLDTQ